jgi:hypothetical protein
MVRDRPEIAALSRSNEPTDWAYQRISGAIGRTNMKLAQLKFLAISLHKWFPDEVPKCERDCTRIWAGCIHYLLQHEVYLIRAKELGHFIDDTSTLANDSPSSATVSFPGQLVSFTKVVLPPIMEYWGNILVEAVRRE